MITTPKYLVDKAKKTIKEIQKINPTEVLKSKYKDATPEERKKVDEINKKLCTFIKNKDIDGAKRYLAHLKKQNR